MKKALSKYNQNNIGENSAGFTLIELLIAVVILAAIIGLGLFISFDFYKSYSFHSERNTIVSILKKARSQSLNNINQTRHGVHFEDNSELKYIIFECPTGNPQCNSYTADPAAEIVINSSFGVSIINPSPLPFDIIFDQLSGNCISTICFGPEPTITITDGSKSYDININSEGRIDW